MKLSITLIIAAFVAVAIPAVAAAAPSGQIGNAVSASGTHSAGCWTAWAKKTEKNSSNHKIGVSWLHAHACGPLRNIRGSVSCTDYHPPRHWTCDPGKTYTFKVYPVKGQLHARKIVGKVGISRQLTSSTARGIALKTCFVVIRKKGFDHLCHVIP